MGTIDSQEEREVELELTFFRHATIIMCLFQWFFSL